MFFFARVYRNIILFAMLIVLVTFMKTREKEGLQDLPLEQDCEENNNATKYITANVILAGGLGNQIWRFASLYGIGLSVSRIPYFEPSVFANEYRNTISKSINLTEVSYVFPAMYKSVNIKNPCPNQKRKLNFAEDCCKFDDPAKLLNIPEQFVKIKGDYLLSYKFFHPYRNDIRQMFECGSDIMQKVNDVAKIMFKKDENIRFCVHIRRGDFLEDIMLESQKHFSNQAINFVGKRLSRNRNNNVSLILIGKDDSFFESLSFQQNMFHEVYKAELKNRGEDLCFGINYCDAMLLTASGSTFGWWMAYLMKSNGPVFYNSQVTDYSNHSKDIHDFDLFLPEWIGLTIKNGKVKKETRWWYERNNVSADLPS